MSLDDIAREVADAGGWKTYELRRLRNEFGRQRAGSSVVQELSAALSDLGCGHLPEKLPNDQNAYVSIYSGSEATLL
jgi:hypothetical protein